MCLSYPAQVVSVDESGALVRGEHRDYRASTILVPDVVPGDHVVVAAGTILERLEPDEAAEIRQLLDRASEAEPAATPDGSVLVLGYGNDLRADDGAGPAVATLVTRDSRLQGCRVESLRQLTPELAPDLAAASLVVFVDATAELPPGEVREVRIAPADRALDRRPFSHHLTPAALIALAESLYGASPEAVVVGIGVGSLEAAGEISPAVQAAIPRAAELVARLVADHHRPVPVNR